MIIGRLRCDSALLRIVEVDFCQSQANAGAAATVRSTAAANRRAILRSPEEFRQTPDSSAGSVSGWARI